MGCGDVTVRTLHELLEVCEQAGWTIQGDASHTTLRCQCPRRHVVALGHLRGAMGDDVQIGVLILKLQRADCLKGVFDDVDINIVDSGQPDDPASSPRSFSVELRGTLPHEIAPAVYESFADQLVDRLQALGLADVVIGGAAVDKCLEIVVTVVAADVDAAVDTARTQVEAALVDLGGELVGAIEWLYAQQLVATERRVDR